MQSGISFNIYVPSYKRSGRIRTWNVVEGCTYVVRQDEEDAYREAGVDRLLVIPENAETKSGQKVSDFMTTLYWIIENTPEEVVCVIDDDIKRFYYRTDNTVPIDSTSFQDPSAVVMDEILGVAQMVSDLGIGFACTHPNKAVYYYNREFSFVGMAGPVRWINKKSFRARLTKDDWAQSDIDMVMQELLANRIILQPNHIVADAEIQTGKGGTAVSSRIMENYRHAMRVKWGVHYKYDKKTNKVRINVQR